MVNFSLNRMRHVNRLEQLLLAVSALAMCGLFWQLCQDSIESWRVHEAALQFAKDLRDIEFKARSANQFLELKVLPATPSRPCTLVVTSHLQEVDRRELPGGVFTTGELKVDPQGVPQAASSFVLTGRGRSCRVEVDARGTVTIP
jgi:hypothetical protein